MPDIFLSYSREDAATARRFADGFARDGFEVLWSPRSVESRWVRAEATLADRNRTLVPAMIETCERPIMFELTQTADLSRWGGDAADRTWQAFVSDLRLFVGAAATESTARQLIPAAAESKNSPAAPTAWSKT